MKTVYLVHRNASSQCEAALCLRQQAHVHEHTPERQVHGLLVMWRQPEPIDDALVVVNRVIEPATFNVCLHQRQPGTVSCGHI